MKEALSDTIVQSRRPNLSWIYHEGFLAVDRYRLQLRSDGAEEWVPSEPLNGKANKLMSLSDRGYITLTQTRLGPCRWAYRATRTRKGY